MELHDGIEVIKKQAFYDCRSLREMLFPPSVRAIEEGAFDGCSGLTTAILNNGLDKIGVLAFARCALVRIDIPPSVRAVKYYAFYSCSALTTAILNDGLEEIGEEAFARCALVHIDIPPSVRAIKDWAFGNCSGLTTVILNDGLEEIGHRAFNGCGLVQIDIPPTVREIDEAFKECSILTNVQFCDEIEEFVSGESMRHWWNNGVQERCLRTYSFFVRCNIPERVGLLLPRMWQSNIHDMLGGIPSISSKGLDSYFHSIDSKLSVYDKLKDAPALLELAVWKSKIIERTDRNIDLLDADMKIECRTDYLTMVVIIFPNVLSFLE